MARDGDEATVVRLDPDRCEALADRIGAARPRLEAMERPADVAALLGLFPSVALAPGHHLDYRVIDEGSAAWIEPFCAADGAPGDAPPPRGAVPLHDRASVSGGAGPASARRREVRELLHAIRFDRADPFSAFEYALFLTELGSFRAEWHAREWLDSSPVFTAGRLEERLGSGLMPGAPPGRMPPLEATVTIGRRATTVRFPVLTPVATARLYVHETVIDARDGFVRSRQGPTLMELGPGLVY
ncbi:hypothetical protein [Miltoncostaea marina]|uniref:hypothetical protein n=1 Tax=Miltoncostaea marina TaxID=2843215 RepID=UPI001C3C9094|nr:hypothetical protein [Miltoncostaea marina]